MSRCDERARMVETQIAARGVVDPRVLAAMRTVPREDFVPPEQAARAYDDTALPIAAEQTISQPYVVALMCEAAEIGPGDRVLEIGTGSGYGAAVLRELAREVFTIERLEALAEVAAKRLGDRRNLTVRVGDGTLGLPESAPYDAILVTAGGPDVPPALLSQLAIGGRLVIPIGATLSAQSLIRFRRTGPNRIEREDLGEVRFVPLIGAHGWRPAALR